MLAEDLPEGLFRNFDNNVEKRIVTWINVAGTINTKPQLYYPILHEYIAKNYTKKGEICLQFVMEMARLGKLIPDNPKTMDIFGLLADRVMDKTLEQILGSRELETMSILLLYPEISKRFFPLLRSVCIEIYQKREESTTNFNPLLILDSFLNELMDVMKGSKRGPRIEQGWLQGLITDTCLHFGNLQQMSLLSATKIYFYIKTCNTLLIAAKKFQQEQLVSLQQLPNQICKSQLTGDRLMLIRDSQPLTQALFELLKLTSLPIFLDANLKNIEEQILFLTDKYFLSCPSISEFWGQFLSSMDLCENIPPYFTRTLFITYFRKPEILSEAVNKLKVTDHIITSARISVNFNDVVKLQQYHYEILVNNPENPQALSIHKIALETLYRPIDTESAIKQFRKELQALEQLLTHYFINRGILLQIQIVNYLPVLKILATSRPDFLATCKITQHYIFYLFNAIRNYYQEPFSQEFVLFLGKLYQVLKDYYQKCEGNEAISFRGCLNQLFEECIRMIDEQCSKIENIEMLGSALEGFIGIFANLEERKLLELILRLIQRRLGYHDCSLQKIARRLISIIHFKDSSSKKILLLQIYDIVIIKNRPLYFSLLLDFAEANKDDYQIQKFLLSKREEMNEVIMKITYDSTPNLRYLNFMVLLETTSNEINESRVKNIGSTLYIILPFLESSMQNYDRVLEIIQKSVNSLKAKLHSKWMAFDIVEPFVSFLCAGIDKIRDQYDQNISCSDEQKFKIVANLSDSARKLMMRVQEVDIGQKKKADHLMRRFLDLKHCAWITEQDKSTTFKINFLTCLFRLNYLLPVLQGSILPILAETISIKNKIPTNIRAQWNVLVVLVLNSLSNDY